MRLLVKSWLHPHPNPVLMVSESHEHFDVVMRYEMRILGAHEMTRPRELGGRGWRDDREATDQETPINIS